MGTPLFERWLQIDFWITAVFWCFLVGVLWDIFTYEVYQGLWVSSNGRAVSLCDSVYSMYRFRGMKPLRLKPTHSTAGNAAADDDDDDDDEDDNDDDDDKQNDKQNAEPDRKQPGKRPRLRSGSYYYLASPKNSWYRPLSLVFWAAVCKFGGGTIVSLLLFETPVWLKGWRHCTSFLRAFALMQLFPGDRVYKFINQNFFVQVVIYAVSALYKMRKIVFCVMHPAYGDENWHVKLLVAFAAVEGNSIGRRLEQIRAGRQLTQLWRNAFNLSLLEENLAFLKKQYILGFMAIVLVGAGQKCWLCPHTSWVDYFGRGWTPAPVKNAKFTASGMLTYFDIVWIWLLEYAFHPLALLLLEFRYLRQLDWSLWICYMKTNMNVTWQWVLKTTRTTSSSSLTSTTTTTTPTTPSTPAISTTPTQTQTQAPTKQSTLTTSSPSHHPRDTIDTDTTSRATSPVTPAQTPPPTPTMTSRVSTLRSRTRTKPPRVSSSNGGVCQNGENGDGNVIVMTPATSKSNSPTLKKKVF